LEKFFFSKSSRSPSIKLEANYPCMKGINVCETKIGPGPHQRVDNHKINANIGWSKLKIFSRTTGPENITFT
jgi:hypothetical protein